MRVTRDFPSTYACRTFYHSAHTKTTSGCDNYLATRLLVHLSCGVLRLLFPLQPSHCNPRGKHRRAREWKLDKSVRIAMAEYGTLHESYGMVLNLAKTDEAVNMEKLANDNRHGK